MYGFYDYPELDRAYHHTQRLREIFKLRNRNQAKEQLEQWISISKQDRYKAFYSAAMSLHWHKETILNFFDHRTTNASADSFNARIKLFRANQKGVRDTKFFLFRICKLYAYSPRNLPTPNSAWQINNELGTLKINLKYRSWIQIVLI